MSQPIEQEYYQALIEKNANYDGIFYVGVKTTGVFCHPTCPARKPKFENCIFYESAHQAICAGYRPCKRCRPLSHPNRVSEIVQVLVEAVEAEPDKKWSTEDVKAFYVDPSTARRQFQKRFGMTFIEYARARRLGEAIEHIQDGTSVVTAQVMVGYDSGSGFRDAFERIIGTVPSDSEQQQVLKSAWIDTPLGTMVVIGDEIGLYLLEFTNRHGLEQEIQRLTTATQASIIPGITDPIQQIEDELHRYFSGELEQFKTPIHLHGTPFQKQVWETLCTIPYGETRSYSDIATSIGKPTAYRAVAQANGANPLALIVPCHRVIASNGKLAGYGGGVVRKKWLIQHEQQGS